MSVSTLMEALNRIKNAPEDSKILVCKTDDRKALLTVFANTVPSKQMISERDSSVIGVYCYKDVIAEADYFTLKARLSKFISTRTASPK